MPDNIHDPRSDVNVFEPGPHLRALATEVRKLYNLAYEATGIAASECVAMVGSQTARELRKECDGLIGLHVHGIEVREDPWLLMAQIVLLRKVGVRGGIPL